MAEIKIVEIPEGMPKGWDIADAILVDGFTKSELCRFVEENSKPVETEILLPQLFDKKSGKPNLNHSTMAQLMKSRFGDRLRFDAQSRKWHIWNGKRFQKDEIGEIYDYAKSTCKYVYDRALEMAKNDNNPKDLFGIANYAISAQNAKNIEDIIKMASKEKGIRIAHNDFDRNEFLFNLQNGTYDLEQDMFRGHLKSDNLTKIVDYEYNADAECPFWEQALEMIFNDDTKKIRFLQRFIGHCLTGSVDEQCLLFFYGKGKNGKSTITSLLEMMFGDYFRKAPADMLMFHTGTRISNDIASIAGTRLVVCDEVQDGIRLDEARVKNLTGGDSITARFLYHESFTFQPTHKLIMFGNHRPNIHGTDDGIWRRMVVVPFNVEIPEEKRIPMGKIKEILKNELSGIFNWALKGYRKYKSIGKLNPPKSIRDASFMYRIDSDTTRQFLSQCCIESKLLKVKCKELYEEYRDWCICNNEFAPSYRAFNERLKEKGLSNKAGTGNLHYWVGVGLKRK